VPKVPSDLNQTTSDMPIDIVKRGQHSVCWAV